MVRAYGIALLAASALFGGAEAAALPAPKQLSLAKPFALENKWKLSGDATAGSDVILLAQKPGQSGAVWSSSSIPYDEWTIEAQIRIFRDSPSDKEADRSGFALWFTDSPLPSGPVHGAADLWDGLAIMMDSLGPDGRGEVRGHLNDGSYRFEASTNLQEDALSLCLLPYRNSEGFVKLTVGYGQGMFVVEVNHQKCFMSTDITLGPGYLGLSANSAGSKDKLVTSVLSITEGISEELLALIPADKRKEGTVAAPAGGAHAAGAAGAASAGDSSAVDVSHKTELPAQIDTKEITGPVLRAIESLGARIDSIPSGNAGAGTGEVAPSPDVTALRKELVGRLDSIESSIKQLVDISSKLALSLSSTDVSNELKNLRTQIDEHQKSLPQSLADGLDTKTKSSDGPGIYAILAIVFGVQAVFVYGALKYWEKQQALHQKLM